MIPEFVKNEKDIKLTMEQVCIIEDFAAQAANDGGFMNSYVFERALLVFAAIVLYPDRKDEINGMIGEGYDVRLAYQTLLETGLLEEMSKDYEMELEYLVTVGETWFQEAKEFEQSARGLLNTISDLSGDIVSQAASKLQAVASGDAKFVEEFADKWGLNNTLPKT